MKLKILWAIFILTLNFAYADLKPINLPKEDGPPKKAEVGKIEVNAFFHFYATDYSPKVPTGTFSMKGTFNHDTDELLLEGVSWIKQPENYEMVPLKGKINKQKTSFTGNVKFDDCKEFILKRTTTGKGSPLSGEWKGSYICAQGVTGLTLTLK